MISSCCSSASDSGINSLKEAVFISPKYCKARMQYFRVADILVQPCLIDAYNVRVFGVHQVLEAMEVTQDCHAVCCVVFVITF